MENMIIEKILLVDDEPNVLEGYKRQLRRQLSDRERVIQIDTALRGEDALKIVGSDGPYAVVVSDMQMPGMDGIQLLSSVRDYAPDTVRIILTGKADTSTAISAVNEGRIFRFLTKPCSPEILAGTIVAGVEQFRLITAERELLEKTLSGSIKVMTDILALVNPIAFSQATRFRRYVRHVISELKISDSWQFEVAAMLSQIGCVTLPPETLEKVHAGADLTEAEQDMFAAHPSVGHDLLIRIPRLQLIARMIERQQEPFSKFKPAPKPHERNSGELGAQILKVIFEFDRLIVQGIPAKAAVAKLLGQPEQCDPLITTTLGNLEIGEIGTEIRIVKMRDLNTHMIIDEDIWTKRGILVVPKGQEINHSVLVRLQNFWRSGAIPDQVRVLVPQYESQRSVRPVPANDIVDGIAN
jgi:response regulator RpfG family c-di-GMP phosphodiesterase